MKIKIFPNISLNPRITINLLTFFTLSFFSQRVVQQQKMPNNTTAVPRRPDPTPSAGTNNSSSLDNYMNTLTQLTGGNTAVSITPAKPKEKAVIDLTDEDEIPPPAPHPISPQQTNSASIAQAQRRSLPAQSSNANVSQQYGRTAPPLARIPPSQVANSNKNRMQGKLMPAIWNASDLKLKYVFSFRRS